MAQYVEQFFFKDGLYDEANILLTKEVQAVEDGKNFVMASGNIRSMDAYSRDSGVSFDRGYGSAVVKSYYGTETNPEPGSYSYLVSAALPILRLKKNTGNGSIVQDIEVLVRTGASAVSLGMYGYLMDDGRNVLASTPLKHLGASISGSVELQFGAEYGLFKNFYLAFGLTGASIAEFWGVDGVRVFGRHNDAAPPSTDVFENGTFVASLSATVEAGFTAALHLGCKNGVDINQTNKAIYADYYFDDVWFLAQKDNLTCTPIKEETVQDRLPEAWFVKKLPALPPYTIENVIMNDRNELLIAGPSLHPHLISGASNSWNASPAIFTFQNSVIGTYTGASVYPAFMMEFKNRLHLFNVNVGQSLAAGVTIQEYPRSILPSGGFTPYLFDWNDEILIDTQHELIAGIEYKGYQFVFTKEEIFYFTYDSNGNATTPEQIAETKGIVNKEAICGSDEHVYYANREGAFRLEGNVSRKISSSVNDRWFGGVKKISAVFNKTKKQILFSDYTPTVDNSGSNGCLVYYIDSGVWSFQDMPIISHKKAIAGSRSTSHSMYLSLYGNFLYDTDNRITTELLNIGYMPELVDLYTFTGDVEIRKKCVLSPGYDKKADPAFLHIQTKATPFASQGYRITTYWDGNPSINFTQTDQFLTQVNNDYLYNVESHKFTVAGQGNILNVILERLPDTHGSKPIEFQSLQVEYDLVDAEV